MFVSGLQNIGRDFGGNLMRRMKVLVVDSSGENSEAFSILNDHGDLEPFLSTDQDSTLNILNTHTFDLIIFSTISSFKKKLDLASVVRSHQKNCDLIFLIQPNELGLVNTTKEKFERLDIFFEPFDPVYFEFKIQFHLELFKQKKLIHRQLEEIEHLRVEADSANLAKGQFLANISHEIRTPLAAVMGFSELIARNNPPNEQNKELMAAIERNGTLLLRLVDDILDLSKSEINQVEIEKSVFNLKELISDIYATVSFRAREKGLDVLFKLPEVIQSNYVSDPTRIKQILLNVVGNAIKFSSSGKIELIMSLQPSELCERLTFFVSDEGIGLSPNQIENLFKPFSQADASTRRNHGGSGLGLAISRQIARSLKGDLTLASSIPGQGSIFKIEILLDLPKKQNLEIVRKNKEPSTVDLRGKTILAVDDSHDNLMLISQFLKDSGAHISFVDSGIQAVDKVKQNNFDLILMDIQMPGMDGNQTTEEIRHLGFSRPILALTAHALRSEHDRCLDAGCTGVLTKPILRATLIEKISEHLKLAALSV